MFRLLKKLTSRLVRVFGTLLPLVLAAPAMAQWGAVTSQPDTNRFINSQQDFGLIMPHQQVIVGLLDTTISSVGIRGGNASKVIVGSLLDHEDNCANYSIINGVASCAGSYEKWRELEKSTSYYQAARGDTTAMFPTNYAITVSTGKDSVKIWNRDTAETWMALREAASVILGDGAINDIAFKDMILYVATETQIYLVDFAADRAHRYGAGGLALYPSNIQEREGVDYGSPVSSTPAITNDAVNTVAAVRDPFGLKDALGRPKHWWSAGTDADNNTFNPHTDTIYRWGWGPDDIDHNAIDDRGFIVTAFLDGSINRVVGRDSEFIRSAVDLGAGSNHWASDNTGDGDIAWAADVRGTDIVIAEPVSWAQNRPRIIYSSAAGVYNLYSSNPASSGPRNQARQRFSATVNAPLEFGETVLAMAFEGNGLDSSPYANDMVDIATPGYGTGVFGQAFDGNGLSSGYKKLAQAEFAPAGSFYIGTWFKSESATNPAGTEHLFQFIGPSQAQIIHAHFNSDGTLSAAVYGASGTDAVASTGDFYDAEWHHFGLLKTTNQLILFIDGVDVGSDDAISFGSLGNIDDIYVGDDWNSSNHFQGKLDDFVVSIDDGGSVEVPQSAIAAIHAEGRKKLGMGTPVFTRTPDDALISNNVVEVDALDNGMWAVAFSDANTVQVFDGRIPVQQIAAPAGTVKSVALIQSPGTDSVGVAIGTTTNLKFVQPAVNLRAAMAHQYQEPIHVGTPVVVDSAGVGGIFWTGDDAIEAGHNAGINHIKFAIGTYGGFDVGRQSMIIEGSSGPTTSLTTPPGTVINGGGVAAAVHFEANGDYGVLRNIGLYTGPGGAGGGYTALHADAADALTIENVYIIASDAVGMNLNGQFALVSNCYFVNTDEIAIQAGNHYMRIIGNTFISNDGQSVFVNNTIDYGVVTGNLSESVGKYMVQFEGTSNNYWAVSSNVADLETTGTCGTCSIMANAIY